MNDRSQARKSPPVPAVTGRPPVAFATAGTIISQPTAGDAPPSPSLDPQLAAIPPGQDPSITLRPVAMAETGPPPTVGYHLLHELGRGGMGAVHAAEQRAFARKVAVKSLLLDGDMARRLFWAEAAATALLEHPNIVPVHDLLVGKEGLPRLVMKLVEGTTWKRLLHPESDADRAKVAEWEINQHLEILLKVCDAVRFAHTRGILHRDLKPENIMVGGFGEVLVMDWGCAVALGDQPPHPLIPLAKNSRVIIGTPAYMAPELARGDGKALGPWSDVYLLGAILYEILTGTAPHREPGSKVDVRAVLAAAKRGVIDPLENRAPGRAMPDELVTLTMAALARDPAARLRDVASFAAGVREYLRHSQAATLLDRARDHLRAAARGKAADADEYYRRAIGCCEQAEELWPGFRAARRLFVRASLQSARHALVNGAFRLADRQGTSARQMARELGLTHEADEASAITTAAARAEHERDGRARQIHLLRIGLIATGLAVMVGLGVGLFTVTKALASTRTARAEAETALGDLRREQDERKAISHQAAPRFVAEASEHMRAFRWDEARSAALIATSLDPGFVQGWRLLGEIDLGGGDPHNAAAALGRCPDAGDLAALAKRWGQRLGGRSPSEGERAALAGDLRQAGAQIAAAYLRRDSTDRVLAQLEDARKRLLVANPRQKNLLWKVEVSDEQVALDCSRNAELTDLSALAGLPITRLNAMRTGVANLVPLAGLPLLDLDLSETRVDDLTPLVGLPLTRLSLASSAVRDLSPLRGMPLRMLDCSRTKVTDFSVLSTLPLSDLRLGHTSFNNLNALRGLKLEALSLDGLAVRDLAPLAGLPLRRLGLSKSQVRDLAPLAGLKLESLDLTSTTVADLRPLRGMPLRRVWLTDTRQIVDLTPLAQAPIDWLDLRRCAVSDVAQLRTFTRLRELAEGALPPLALCPPGNDTPDADQLAQRADGLADSLRQVPALANTVAAIEAVSELARWRRSGSRSAVPGALIYQLRAYRLIDAPVTWDEARRVAAALGARLACLDSQGAIDFATKSYAGQNHFLGASKGRGDWRWASSGPLTAARWATGQPAAGGAGDLWLASLTGKGWTPVPSTFQAGFLLEWTP